MSTLNLELLADEISSVAIQRADKVRDGQHQKLPYLEGLESVHGKGKPNFDGAEKITQTVDYADHSQATDQTGSRGFKAYNLTTRKTEATMVFTPAFVGIPIVISVVEMELNGKRGGNQIHNKADTRTKNAMRYAMRTWHKQLVQGGQPGFTSWGTLNGTDYATGIIEEDANGAQGNVLGGLDKSGYLTVPSMQNQLYDLDNSVGQNGRLAITKMLNRIEEYSEADASDCIGLATEEGLANLSMVMAPHMRYAPAQSGGGVELAGPAVTILGRKVRQSSHMPTAGTNTTASPWSALWLNCADIRPCWLKNNLDGFFGLTDFEAHGGDRRVLVAFIDVNGYMHTAALNTSGLLIKGQSF